MVADSRPPELSGGLLFKVGIMVKDYNPYAENEFSWAQWTPNTELKLCNVTWDSSYRDIVKFVSRETQQAYFNGLAGETCAPGTMHKPTEPVLIEMPFNQASNWNYLVAYNDYPELETPRYWYYFIQSVEYVNAHTTRLYLMLDVWQSFQFDITIGSSYIVRGHIGVANERQFDDYGRTYLALPEGLDTGSEMVATSQIFHNLVGKSDIYNDYDYGVFVVSTTDMQSDPGTTESPTLKTAGGSSLEGQANGTSIYYMDADAFATFMPFVAEYPWVSQGIVSIYMVPRLDDDFIQSSMYRVKTILGKNVGTGTPYQTLNVYGSNVAMKSTLRYKDMTFGSNFRSLFNIPERYRNLKKLLCYPYCVIECSCLNGTVITYRPEDVQSNDFVLRRTFCLAPNGCRWNFYPVGYNEAGAQTIEHPLSGNDGLPIDGGEMLYAAFGISNMPTFATVNNGAQLALANSAYTRAYTQQSAEWSYTKAQLGLNQAGELTRLGQGQASTMNALNRGQRNASAALQQNQNTASSTLQNAYQAGMNNFMRNVNFGTAAAGGVVTAAGGNLFGGLQQIAGAGVNAYVGDTQTTMGIDVRDAQTRLANNGIAQSTGIANTYGSAAVAAQNQYAGEVYDINRRYGMMAASGDYRNAIAGINAQVQQMQLTPPTTSGAIGGDPFNLANGIFGVLVRFKTCAPSALAAVGEYMLRYGYFIQRFLTPPASLMCMTHFTYWQMQECYIRGTLPEQYRMTIKGVFEQGVTVWASPNDIGVLDWADNDPLPGISY